MPLFDYQCHKCGHMLKDVLVRSQAPRPCHCEQEMQRLPSAPAFTVGGYNAKNGYTKEGR